MKMFNPAKPGEILSGWLADLDVSISAFSRHIGISRATLSKIVNVHGGISADMDLRLSEALGTSPGYWLKLQTQRDLWEARQQAKKRQHIEKLAA
jgi:addiction module HigA family antidote